MFKTLAHLGTDGEEFQDALKIKITNIISLITVFISGLYSLNYLVILNEPVVAYINFVFTASYALPLLFNYKGMASAAKTTFFIILMLHLLVCTNVYVTNATGFHLYFFLVPTGAFLLFKYKEVVTKIVLSVIALVLFFYCENTLNLSPLIVLSDSMNNMIYQSVVAVNMIEVVIVMTIFVKQIENNEYKLGILAKTDSLTGVANRHHFFENGSSLLAQAKINERPFTLALIDLDHFKKLNDNYGHLFGDACLKEIAKLITSELRSSDLFARYGGEEFIVAMPDTTQQEANNIVEQIRINIEKYLIEDESLSAKCTISAGIASASNVAYGMKQLISCADKALYQAKQNGRNRVVSYA